MVSPFARLVTSSLRETTPAETAAAKAYCERLLASSTQVLVIGKSTCPRCTQAVELLSSLVEKQDIRVVMLDLMMETETPDPERPVTTVQAIQDFLWDLTGARTVPRIFVGGKSCGGYDDVLAQHESGTLDLSMGENKILDFSAALSHSAVGNIFGAATHASAIGANLGRRGPPVEIIVECKISQKEAVCYILPHLTGLQMKSAILKELGLDGGFGDYYLRCEDVPFGSRCAVSNHPGFKDHCRLVLEEVGDRPRANGHT